MATQTTFDSSTLAGRIKQARLEMPHTNGKHISQVVLANQLGVHWVSVSQWERAISTPTLANLIAIAKATGKPLEFFTNS